MYEIKVVPSQRSRMFDYAIVRHEKARFISHDSLLLPLMIAYAVLWHTVSAVATELRKQESQFSFIVQISTTEDCQWRPRAR